jgi:carboxyl-terminal processing protease
MNTLGKVLFAGSVALALIIGAAGGVLLDRQVLTPSASAQDQGLNIPLLQEAYNTIKENYVDQSAVQPQALTYGAISGMTDALGDTGHSRFLTPDMVRQEHMQTQGEYEGIGANVSMVNGHVVIVAPMDGSPAQAAGIKPGEIILKVDGQDVTGLSLSDVVSKILGPAGTTVTLTLQDATTGQVHDVTVKRAKITIHNLTWAMIPGTHLADIRISAFSSGVTDDLKNAIQQARAQGATGIVLDLRNNPGGLLDEAENTASQFLKSGLVLNERNAKGTIKPIPVKPGGVATDIPMVVLINNASASAAEIVAGALQDNHRATLVGETTFGTGTVLIEFPLTDGSVLLLATQEWLTPNGHSIWHKGITPDVTVPLNADVQLLTPDQLRTMSASGLQANPDQQFLKALDLLEKQTGQS